MKKSIAVFLFFLFIWSAPNDSFAQIDTLRTLDKDLLISNLDTGLKQFLVYMVDKKTRTPRFFSLWNRTTEFGERDGKPTINITQEWLGDDERFQRSVYTVVDRKNFRSLYHWTYRAETIEAFNFEKTRIIGADSVKDNAMSEFEVDVTPHTLNWELDLETFEVLPYAQGKKFVIHFYHPGGQTPPKYYLYEVIGSEQLKSAGVGVDCWMLKINYDGGNNHATFWISKESRQVLKMEEHYNNIIRYKVRLGTEID